MWGLLLKSHYNICLITMYWCMRLLRACMAGGLNFLMYSDGWVEKNGCSYWNNYNFYLLVMSSHCVYSITNRSQEVWNPITRFSALLHCCTQLVVSHDFVRRIWFCLLYPSFRVQFSTPKWKAGLQLLSVFLE